MVYTRHILVIVAFLGGQPIFSRGHFSAKMMMYIHYLEVLKHTQHTFKHTHTHTSIIS